MEYDFRRIEKDWQQKWQASGAYKASNISNKPKYYVLDMFPYPSGAGLHVGHPLGYIASDIFARYKRLKGFNVLHPMGYDAFGLPAEQYAIEHGIHPAVSTEQNINNFRRQLDNIGFCFDWDREIRTSDPAYYKWTQWIFLQLFDSWFNRPANKADRIASLVKIFEQQGNAHHPCPGNAGIQFTASEWNAYDEIKQQQVLMEYRLAYCGYGEVNWCEALGTVLANDEVVNGVSERGGYPVVKKKLRQWYLRITEYADRLLEGLERVDFSEAMKEMQTNWIGKSYGAEIEFAIGNLQSAMGRLRVYTTRPDTIFGVDFMVIAPEHELIEKITTAGQKQAVEDYITYVKSRSERERMAEKKISGVFTGAYALNPFNNKEIPIWISEYVLAGYGTGAIMAVPCGDERDHKFANHFNIPITNIIGAHYNGEEANPTKDAVLENSDFINGMVMRDAIEVVIKKIEELGIGIRKVNYKMRDAAFSRQRYWGEPFPIVWKDNVAYPLPENELPVLLPHMDELKPGPDAEGPLANLTEWYLIPGPSPQVEKGGVGAANVPKYKVPAPVQYELARTMRKEYTEAEDVLWQALRGNQLGVKFRRQHPIESYIVDFICLQDRLIVEVDGGYHETTEQKLYDENRTKVLTELGFKVIRFTNDEVINNLKSVKERIKKILSEPASPLSTPGRGDGGEVWKREVNTMPGYAGSSWYFLRYMDPHNDKEFCARNVSDYWGQVDLYIGGTEHAVGHLLYSRMWTKALYDLGYIGHDEPYKKLVNQGMITGVSQFADEMIIYINRESPKDLKELPQRFAHFDVNGKLTYRELGSERQYKKFLYSFDYSGKITKEIIHRMRDENDYSITYGSVGDNGGIRIPIRFVNDGILNLDNYISYNPDAKDFVFITEGGWYADGKFTPHIESANGIFYTKPIVEKMSKSKYNVVNPDEVIEKYGADTFRMYEMFLGPVEQSKPWETKGIEGVHRFIKKLWRLFYDEQKGKVWKDEKATPEELKALHKAIKKIEEDTERFSFNTAVSAFMICVNELGDLKCHKKEILEPVLILLTPYAPHVCEELWHLSGNTTSILDAPYPKAELKYLVESVKEYPISVNGRLRTTINIALDARQETVEQIVLSNEVIQKWLEGKPHKKIIFVKGKMVNVVV